MIDNDLSRFGVDGTNQKCMATDTVFPNIPPMIADDQSSTTKKNSLYRSSTAATLGTFGSDLLIEIEESLPATDCPAKLHEQPTVSCMLPSGR